MIFCVYKILCFCVLLDYPDDDWFRSKRAPYVARLNVTVYLQIKVVFDSIQVPFVNTGSITGCETSRLCFLSVWLCVAGCGFKTSRRSSVPAVVSVELDRSILSDKKEVQDIKSEWKWRDSHGYETAELTETDFKWLLRNHET